MPLTNNHAGIGRGTPYRGRIAPRSCFWSVQEQITPRLKNHPAAYFRRLVQRLVAGTVNSINPNVVPKTSPLKTVPADPVKISFPVPGSKAVAEALFTQSPDRERFRLLKKTVLSNHRRQTGLMLPLIVQSNIGLRPRVLVPVMITSLYWVCVGRVPLMLS